MLRHLDNSFYVFTLYTTISWSRYLSWTLLSIWSHAVSKSRWIPDQHLKAWKLICSNTAGNNLDVMLVHRAYYTTDTEQKPTDSALLTNSAERYTVNVT